MTSTATELAPSPVQIPNKTDELLSAITHYQAAKAQLDRAKELLAEAEAEVISLVGHKDEGSFNCTVDDRFKVTTTGKINRRLLPSFKDIRAQIPPALLSRLVRTKEELNTRELKFIEQNEPDIYKFIAQAIEIKPGKPSLKIEAVQA